MTRMWIAVAMVAMGCVGSVDAPSGGDDVAVDAGVGGDDVDAAPSAPDGGGDGSEPECYSEAVTPAADISDVIAAYGGPDWKDDLIEAMARRHPATAFLLDAQRDDSYFDQFSDSASWPGMVSWLDTLAHEETHLFNAYHAIDVGELAAIYVREDLIYYLPADPGFARGEIYDDLDQAALDGIYADTYLTGSQGQRGFNELLDELSCYLNEMAAVGSVGEHFVGGVSLRDGSVAFLYFVQVYLRVARTEQPAVYAALRAEPVYRDVVETLWLRTHFFLPIADAFPGLGIDDDEYRALIHRPENLAEIEMFTGRAVGDSACLLD